MSTPPGGSSITVNGFVRTIRKQKTKSFAAIGDGTSLEPFQAILQPSQAEKYVEAGRVDCSDADYVAALLLALPCD